jgi:ABC-2 type transport system ATP-binding protein
MASHARSPYGAVMTDEQSPLVVDRFGRRYRRNRPWAVRGVSLSLPKGSITALVGANGAGKSTLIRACVGFERPDEGRVLVDGIDPRRDRARAVAAVGYVPQAAALYRSLTVGDHLDLARYARRSFDRAYALTRVTSAGLAETRKVGDLSGGEQAQVSLALALGTRAHLLLLDEPLASLDPLARRAFLTTLVDDVRGRGATALLSSHIVTDVDQACDRLVVLADGRLVLDTAGAVAKAAFRVLLPNELGGMVPIGTFSSQTGETLALVKDPSLGRPASLEEIVLGHLASRSPGLAAVA